MKKCILKLDIDGLDISDSEIEEMLYHAISKKIGREIVFPNEDITVHSYLPFDAFDK